MRLMYVRPELNDMSQGSRIAFIREFRHLSQDDVSYQLGAAGENKRRTMNRYERGDRNPKEDRTLEISKILNTSYESIKKYDFSNSIGKVYLHMLEEEKCLILNL